MSLIGIVFFRSAGLHLAMELGAVKRILPTPALDSPPGAPPSVEGFFDYQGRAVAALRLDRLLGGREDALGLYAPLILLAGGEPATALHVAAVDGVSNADSTALQPIGDDETFNGCVASRFTDNAGTIYLIRPEALQLSTERARLAAFAAMHQARLDALAEASDAA